MPTSGEYRQSADECRRLAEDAEDQDERDTLLELAHQWDRLAEHKANLESQS
jgi:hypothetical protein